MKKIIGFETIEMERLESLIMVYVWVGMHQERKRKSKHRFFAKGLSMDSSLWYY